MKTELFFVEVGVILDKENEEFDCYTIRDFYDDEFAFYDENRLTFLDYEHAKKYADDYVNRGVNRTYAIIHNAICDITDDEYDDIICNAYCEYSLDNFDKKDVLYFIHKENKEIIKEI